MWLGIHGSNRFMKSFQVDVVRHVQSDSKQQVSCVSKISLSLKLTSCMWLGILKYIYLIQSILMDVVRLTRACQK